MNNQFNPYQPPSSNIIKNNPENYWTDGKYLIMPFSKSELWLPHRCIYCNAPVEETSLIKRKLYWHAPIVYFLIFLNLLIYAVVAVAVRKKTIIHIGLCNEHKNKRTKALLASWSALFIGFVLIFIGAATDYHILFLVGILTLLASIVALIRSAPILIIKKIDSDLVYFHKCGKPFLDSLSNRPVY